MAWAALWAAMGHSMAGRAHSTVRALALIVLGHSLDKMMGVLVLPSWHSSVSSHMSCMLYSCSGGSRVLDHIPIMET